MFDTTTHIIICSDYCINLNPGVFIYYRKHYHPEVKTNIYFEIKFKSNRLTISLNPTAARFIARQLLNCADEMDLDEADNP